MSACSPYHRRPDESILGWINKEGWIFNGGSGFDLNLAEQRIHSKHKRFSRGGKWSDQVLLYAWCRTPSAGMIKSSSTTGGAGEDGDPQQQASGHRRLR